MGKYRKDLLYLVVDKASFFLYHSRWFRKSAGAGSGQLPLSLFTKNLYMWCGGHCLYNNDVLPSVIIGALVLMSSHH
jgi:hypothetical protein